MFLGKIHNMRQHGLEWKKHKNAIRTAYMAKTYDTGTLAVDNTVSLQRNCILR